MDQIDSSFPISESKQFHLDQPRALSEEVRRECLNLLAKIDFLEARLSRLESKKANEGQSDSPEENKPRKHRRRNNEMSKHLICIAPDCKKKYGSVTSLKLHLKRKHGMRVKKKRLQEEIYIVKN